MRGSSSCHIPMNKWRAQSASDEYHFRNIIFGKQHNRFTLLILITKPFFNMKTAAVWLESTWFNSLLCSRKSKTPTTNVFDNMKERRHTAYMSKAINKLSVDESYIYSSAANGIVSNERWVILLRIRIIQFRSTRMRNKIRIIIIIINKLRIAFYFDEHSSIATVSRNWTAVTTVVSLRRRKVFICKLLCGPWTAELCYTTARAIDEAWLWCLWVWVVAYHTIEEHIRTALACATRNDIFQMKLKRQYCAERHYMSSKRSPDKCRMLH